MKTNNTNNRTDSDVVLIGGGIMSATLGILLKELQPELKIDIYERLEEVAAESTDAWNNAGTGHSAYCELNYTPELPDGSLKTSKAVRIAEQFLVSRQFWAYLVEKGYLESPQDFLNKVPHMSFVIGEDNVDFLKKRYESLKDCPLFKGMKYSEDFDRLAEWVPLIMQNRERTEKVAATRMSAGTDVNFGALTRGLMNQLEKMPGVRLFTSHEVEKFAKKKDGSWEIKVKNLLRGENRTIQTKFVFIGAGGGALPLLLKTGIPESKGFGGFPVSGQWLICQNPEVIEKHAAKVYGKAAVGAPPMSVPHLDTRIIDGKKALLFGPYAGFTTKFLKKGSKLDLIKSIKPTNLGPMLSAGLENFSLTKYLIDQVMQSPEDRLETLRLYLPDAKLEDWKLEDAGKRVQVIKDDPEEGGVLEFGTEVVSSSDGSLAALLGASPGASTAVSIMLDLFRQCFPEKLQSPEWQAKLKEMIPTYGQSIAENEELCTMTREKTAEILGLEQLLV